MMVSIRNLKGKKALITGGSSGIGLATARALSDLGSKVIITARDPDKLKKAERSVTNIVSSYSVDISDLDGILRLVYSVEKDHGKIDILINSAGIVHPGVLDDLTFEQIGSTIDTDLTGTINVTKAMLPLLKTPGYIINISSVAGFLGLYGYSAYSAAKFGIWGFSQALRMELEPIDIGVGVVFPPDTDTPQLEFENRTKPKELKTITGTIKPIKPEKVADSIIAGITKGKFMIFPDSGSRSTYHASRLAGPVIRGWMDGKIPEKEEEGIE